METILSTSFQRWPRVVYREHFIFIPNNLFSRKSHIYLGPTVKWSVNWSFLSAIKIQSIARVCSCKSLRTVTVLCNTCSLCREKAKFWFEIEDFPRLIFCSSNYLPYKIVGEKQILYIWLGKVFKNLLSNEKCYVSG